MTRVRVLVAHDRNRELLVQWLDRTYDVTADVDGDEALSGVDLCLADAAGFAANRERLTDWKQRTGPVFAPVLLLGDGSPGDRTTGGASEGDDWRLVDEVVEMPLDKAVFGRRLENLLSRRELSTDLARSYRESEQRFASLFQATPDPALVLSDGHVTYVNDAFCHYCGVARDNVRWRGLDELACFPDETVATLRRQIERATAPDRPGDDRWRAEGDGETDWRGASADHSGGAVSGVARSATASGDAVDADRAPAAVDGRAQDTETVLVEPTDGRDRYFETSVNSTTVDDRGSVALVMRDVTERRERERELRRKNERLEEFASVVSHDLRNPIQVAQGYVGALADGADMEECLPPLRRNVGRMEALVDDLLTLAREGETAADRSSVALPEVARRAWETTDAPDATLAVRTDRTVLADDGRLAQLFENLFRNSVEHGSTSPRSQGREDSVEHGPEGVAVVVGDLADGTGFFVADDGPGIPPDEREAVLETGYSNGDGTGLGLGIVTDVAEAHGWTVAVTEGDAGGARFEFRGVDGPGAAGEGDDAESD